MKKFLPLFLVLTCVVNAQLDRRLSETSFSEIDTLYSNSDLKNVSKKVDSLMELAISKQAFPGAQLLVLHKGNAIFNKTYGYHTYDSLQPVSKDDLYDLASVTKITAALPAIMKLVDQGKMDLDAPFSAYWKPWQHRRDKREITVREVLAHQAGLQPYIVFVNYIRKNDRFKRRFVRNEPSARFSVTINDTLYLNPRFYKKMNRIISRSEVTEEKKYKYSGLSFLLYPQLVTDLSGEPFESFVTKEIYEPLGANHLMFNPKGKYPEELIVPTEIDSVYRGGLVHSWVHDENASIMGGVSGNAGLFGTAEDLGKLMQLYLQLGEYQGKQLISKETMKEFTRVQYPENDNRRGLGFDKPSLPGEGGERKWKYPAPAVSPQSFGHSGFTGTFVWADPAKDLVFVFLSNRVYPSREHLMIYDLKVRENLLEYFCELVNPESNARYY